MGRLKVVVAEPIREQALARLAARHDVVRLQACGEHELLAAVGDASALVVRTYSPVTAAVIAAAPLLRVIARAGSGVENIDVKAARAAGIPVVYRPAAATAAVAELTIGLLIALERRVLDSGREVASGRFADRRNAFTGRQLSDMTLGIVGCGRIGSRVARMAHAAFEMPIVFNDIRPVQPGVAARSLPFEELLGAADAVSLHVPLTPRTRHLIDASALRLMKPGALLINTARGAVLDAGAVAEALRADRLGGAAIDVFDPEPPPEDHPLRHAPRCILTPHIGARTRTALEAMSDVVDDVLAVLDGREPEYPFTDEWG
jgi:D-3-phosphoglycerate dehydrogenase